MVGHGRERGQAGRLLVLPDRPSAGPGRQAAAEAGQRVRDRACGPPGPGPGEGGHRRRPAASRPSADGGRPGRRVVGGGAAQPEGVDVQQLRLADAGLRGAQDRAQSGWIAFRRPTSRSCTRTCALRAGGKERRCPGTQVRNIHRVLHNALNYAVRLGYIARNPTEAIDKPRDDTEERTGLHAGAGSPIPRSRWKVIGSRPCGTWCWRPDCAGRNWPDCDGGTWRWIGTHRSWPCGRRGRPPAIRWSSTIPRADRAGGCCTLMAGRPTCSVAIVRPWPPRPSCGASSRLPDYVFVDEFGDPFHPARLTRDLHALQRRAGLPEITLHDLRHTAATIALLAGVHPKVVSERHGHASTQITLDRYSHVLESMQEAAADAIGRFLRPE